MEYQLEKKGKKNEGGLSCKSTRKRINNHLGCIFWESGMDSTKMLLSEYVGIPPIYKLYSQSAISTFRGTIIKQYQTGSP